MFKTTPIPTPKTRLALCLACVLGAATSTHALAAKETPAPAAAAKTYSIINLGTGTPWQRPKVNAKGQVAFSLYSGSENSPRGWFFDGKTVRDIGTLGGPTTTVAKMNDAGQVVGFSDTDTLGHYHAFLWSSSTGMIDLGTLNGDPNSSAYDINNSGRVVGLSDADGLPRAFHWTRAGGMEFLGALGSFGSYSLAINDDGLVAGASDAGPNVFGTHAFAWTRGAGMIDLGTLGGFDSTPVAIGAKGEVAGYASARDSSSHAFIWTRRGGMRDLGTGGGAGSYAYAMSPDGHVVGSIAVADGGFPIEHPMSWTKARGMIDLLGTMGGYTGVAEGVNTKGQVVGYVVNDDTGIGWGFAWTSAHGIVDLNKFVRHMPKGLRIEGALSVSDDGQILVQTTTGLALLKPGSGHTYGPVPGPIAAPEMVAVGSPYSPTATFANEDTAATHSVNWTWGDGSSEQAAKASERDGDGSAGAMHVYTRPGIYTVSALIADRSGKSATVSRNVIVYDPAGGFAGGMGTFMSPLGANKKTPMRSGKASFTFVAPSGAAAARAGAKPQLFFNAGGLSFRSEDFAPVAVQGGTARFEGSGKVNGAQGYRFTLAVTAGAAKAGRFALKIWHTDPATKAQVVDYDNQAPARKGAAAATGGAGEGSVVAEGNIALQL